MARTDNGRAEYKERVKKDIYDLAQGRYLKIYFEGKYGEPEQKFEVKIGEFIKFSYRTRNPILMHERHATALKLVENFKISLKLDSVQLSDIQIASIAEQIFAHYCKHCDRKDSPMDNDEILETFYKYHTTANDRTETTYKTFQGILPFAEAKCFEDWSRLFYEFDINIMENFHKNKRVPESDPAIEALEVKAGAVTTWWITMKNIRLRPKDRVKLLYAVVQESINKPYVGFIRKEDADRKFDYEEIIKQGSRPKGPELISEVFMRWEKEKKRSFNTLRQWKPKIDAFIAYVGHDEIKRIKEDDVEGWKDQLLSKGIKPRTIAGGYLSSLQTIFSFARKKRWIKSNPAEYIKLSKVVPKEEMQKPYTDNDIELILAACRSSTNTCNDQTIHWMSPLLIYTGARAGEIAQLWAEQITIEDGKHVIEIRPSPDGGTIKNETSIRSVPIHSTLIEMGFLDFVKSRKGKPLFYDERKRSNEQKHSSDHIVAKNGRWITTLDINLKNKRPNHAFRHWFKTKLSKMKVQDSIADMIQGHSPPGEAKRYRHRDIKTMADAIELIKI